MTLRTVEIQFSEQLLEIAKQKSDTLFLNQTLPLIDLTYPKVLWAKLNFENNPQQGPLPVEIPSRFYACYKDLAAAQAAHPQIKSLWTAHPYQVGQFLASGETSAIFDFKNAGAAVVSKAPVAQPNENKLFHHLIPPWLCYALSAELWGPEGKWTRFHERLHQLFDNSGLLKGESAMGYYPLNKDAQKLEGFGVKGCLDESTYTLTMPWNFSLSDLKKLEQIIKQEL